MKRDIKFITKFRDDDSGIDTLIGFIGELEDKIKELESRLALSRSSVELLMERLAEL